MQISYEKLWKLVQKNKMNRQDLAKAAEISANTVTKLGKNETVDELVTLLQRLMK